MGQLRSIPLGSMVLGAFGAWAVLPQRPRFRGLLPLRVGVSRDDDFSLPLTLALLGLPSLRLSPPSPWPQRLMQGSDEPHSSRSAYTTGKGSVRTSLASSRRLREHPFWVLFPVLQSVKEQGSWLASSEAAGL
jgi:hypothetical protein